VQTKPATTTTVQPGFINGKVPAAIAAPIVNSVEDIKDAVKARSEPYPKAGDGEWSRTGWEPRFGDGMAKSAEVEPSLLDHTTMLEEKLDDKFFGGLFLLFDSS